MALQTPLVLISGAFSTLPPGDTIPGTDAVAQASGNAALVLANTALASGNAGISTGLTALASGNAGISTGLTALASGNAGISTGLTALASGNAGLVSASNKVPISGGTMTGDLTLNAQSDLRFADADSSNYVAFQAPTTVSTNLIWTLPSTDAALSGYALVSNASGTLSWAAAAGATGGGSDLVFFENDQTVTTSYTLTTNKNAMSAGTITVNSGAVVTIPSGASWVVV